jgi:tRNA(Ile)-lysidine synthase
LAGLPNPQGYNLGKMDIVKRVFMTIRGYDLIREGESVLMGISGGPDSMAMLYMLKEINEKEHLGWQLHIGHINHMLRDAESDQDESFVKKIAKELDIPFTSKKINVREIKKKERMSLEEAARFARHYFLKDLAFRLAANKIALAHNLDDQAETILLRIIRGTSLRGLKGMTPIRLISRSADMFIVRPLIEIERREIEVFLKERNIPCRIDASNLDTTFARNRLRHILLPEIERQFNPKVKISLVKLGQVSASSYVLLREIANEVFESLKMLGKEDEICLSVEEFVKTPTALQTLVIDKVIKNLLGKLPQLNFDHYLGILSLCNEEGKNRQIMLPKGLVAERDSYIIRIYKVKKIEPTEYFEREVVIGGKTATPELGIEIETEMMEMTTAQFAEFLKEKDYKEEVIDFEKLELPIKVRIRKRGDVFVPLGSAGSTKLKKFFIDKKVPEEIRDRIPLLTDGKRIIWVMGFRISEDVKVSAGTKKFLKLRFAKIT